MLEKIKNLYIFEWLDKQILETILSNSKIKNYKKSEKIIQEGENTTDAYILLSGIVSVLKEKKIINTIFEWDIFWEIAFILDEPRWATIQAETDIETLVISKNTMEKLQKIDINGDIIGKTILNRIIQNHKKSSYE